MIGSPEFRRVDNNRTRGVEKQPDESPSKTHSAHPPPQKPAAHEPDQWRHQCARQVEWIRGQRPQTCGEQNDRVIERRGRMRCYAGRKVLELMMPDDCAGILVAQPRARHSRITISVSEIDSAVD